MSAYCNVPFIAGLLVTLAGLYGVYRLYRLLAERDRRQLFAVVSEESAQRHLALIYLVRIGEGILLIPLLLVILMIGLGFLLDISPFRKPLLYGETFSVCMLAIVLMTSAAGIARTIYGKWRPDPKVLKAFRRVSGRNISNFAFFFAAFAAHDFYRLMPPGAPYNPSLANRDFLWIVVFFGCWHGVKALLGYLLELNSAESSQTPPDDPDIPEYQLKGPRAFL